MVSVGEMPVAPPRALIPLIGLIGVAVCLLYLVGLDQGWLLSLVQGNVAFDMNVIHEFVHDARHAAGFPCH
jgi:hypothetical protein